MEDDGARERGPRLLVNATGCGPPLSRAPAYAVGPAKEALPILGDRAFTSLPLSIDEITIQYFNVKTLTTSKGAFPSC